MKKYSILLLITVGFFIGTTANSNAQSIELVAGNTLNGAMNGVLLGGATMALQNSEDFEPARIGLGAGTLYGIGVGIYDISRVSKGQQFYISGTFNDGENSSILVLLDTFYGAAGGALIASSVSLIIQSPLKEALQYGSGIGAWAGFGFGLLDAFKLAEGPNFSQQSASLSQKNDIGGLITYRNKSESINIGVLEPGYIKQKKIANKSIAVDFSPSVDMVQFKWAF